MVYKIVNINLIKEEVKNLIYPRESFIINNDQVFMTMFNFVLSFLNNNVFNVRFIELYKDNSSVDLLLNEHLITKIYSGTKVGKVLNIFNCSEDVSFFNAWRVRFATNPNFLINLIRYNQDFLDFIFSFTVYNQLRQRFSNKNVDWDVVRIGEGVYKIILGKTFMNVNKIMISFLPYFISYGDEVKVLNEDGDVEIKNNFEWLFTDKEYYILCKYLSGFILYKEGVALSELDVTGNATNKDLLITEGKEIMEKCKEEIVSYHTKIFARRI